MPSHRFASSGLETSGVSRVLTSGVDAPAEARHALVGLPLSQDAHEKLALVVSELVTNAVMHAGRAPGEAVQLQVTRQQRCVRVKVRDGGRGFEPAPPKSSDPPIAGGRGLMIVAEFSEAWGVAGGADDFTVWCDVPVEESERVIEHPAIGAYVRELASK